MAGYVMGVDPAPGQRFIVGVGTPQNQYTLGFGATPEEIQARKRRQLASQMGVSDVPGVENLDESIIAKMGLGRWEDTQNRQYAESQRAQELQQAQAVEMEERQYREGQVENQRRYIEARAREAKAQEEADARLYQEKTLAAMEAQYPKMSPIERETLSGLTSAERGRILGEKAEERRHERSATERKLASEAQRARNQMEIGPVLDKLHPDIVAEMPPDIASGAYSLKDASGIIGQARRNITYQESLKTAEEK